MKRSDGTGARRRGIKDTWNAFMVEGAEFDVGDIPVCPTTAGVLPGSIISWPEAKRLHKKMLRHGKKDYACDSFVHFYVDDYKFDGRRRGIWLYPLATLEVLRHFEGVITPDFSTNQDFPEPIKTLATYRKRAFGYWLGRRGIAVINNVRWGTRETWRYSYSGIPKHSVVCIGTVGGSPRKLCDRTRFESGFFEMLSRLEPETIIVIGSADYRCLREASEKGANVVSFESEMAMSFKRTDLHE